MLATYLPLQPAPIQKLILRTFRSVFPYMTVVYEPHNNPGGDYILGSQAPITFSPAALQATFGSPAAQADLAGAPDFPVESTALVGVENPRQRPDDQQPGQRLHRPGPAAH